MQKQLGSGLPKKYAHLFCGVDAVYNSLQMQVPVILRLIRIFSEGILYILIGLLNLHHKNALRKMTAHTFLLTIDLHRSL